MSLDYIFKIEYDGEPSVNIDIDSTQV